VFAWILVQNKLLTADNLALRGWPHQDNYILCNGPLERGLHLCLNCPFAQEVWSTVAAWENFGNLQQVLQTQADTLIEWWELTLTSVQKERRREFNGMAIHIMWNLWKERNRRIFNNNSSTALQVAGRAKDDLVQYRRAFTTPSH